MSWMGITQRFYHWIVSVSVQCCNVYQTVISLHQIIYYFVIIEAYLQCCNVYQTVISLHQIIYYFVIIEAYFLCHSYKIHKVVAFPSSFMLHSFFVLFCSVPYFRLLRSEPVLLPAFVAAPTSGLGPSGCTVRRHPTSICPVS